MGREEQRNLRDRPDTDWRDLTLQNSWVAGGVVPQFRAYNGIVYFRGQLDGTSGTKTDSTPVASFPPRFAPEVTLGLILPTEAADGLAKLDIQTDGDIQVFNLGADNIIDIAGMSYPL